MMNALAEADALCAQTVKREQAEDHFRQFFEQLPVAYHSMDEQGILREVNSAWLAQLGYQREEVIGRWFGDFLAGDGPALFRQHFPLFKERGETHGAEFEMRRKDGATIVVSFDGRIVRDMQGKFVRTQCVFANITERKQAEHDLQASETRYRRLFEGAKDGILILDAETGRIVDANPFLLHLLGYSPEQLLGKRLWEIGEFSDIAASRDAYAELRAKGYVRYEDLPLETRDGRRVNVEFVSNVYEVNLAKVIQCNIRDITERKRAEGVARRSAMQLSVALEAAGLGTWQYDHATDMMHLDARARTLFGVDRDALPLAEMFARVHPEDVGRLRQDVGALLDLAVSTGHLTAQVRWVDADGAVRWLSGSSQVLFDGEGAGRRPVAVAGTIQDTTESKRRETLLRIRAELAEASQHMGLDELLQSALDKAESFTGSCIGFFHFVDPDQENLTLQAWSANTLKQMCMPERKGQHCLVSEAGVWAECVSTRTTVIHNDYESLPHKKGLPPGHVRVVRELVAPILHDGLVAGIMGVGNKAADYTQGDAEALDLLAAAVIDPAMSKRAQEALRESEERYRSLIELSPDAIWLTRDNQITFVNRAALTLLGATTAEQILGKSPLDLTHPDYHDLVRRRIHDQLETGNPVPPIEERLIRLDGAYVDVEISAAPVKDRGSIVTQAVLRDITQRKRAEEEKSLLEAKLAQQQKLESIGTLASGVAHEINNPVNGAMNYAQLILDAVEPDSPLAEYATEIVHETERVAAIVRNLLQFARVDKQAHSPARVQDIVEQTLSLIRTVMRHDQTTLQVDVPESLPRVRCRSQQIQQVLMNLLTNARDALNARYPGYHEDKLIRVSAEAFDRAGRQWVRVTVEDHGHGIPPEVRERIFDPFFTTKPKDVGTGLGLSISHGIVKEHDGELHFETEPGQWTRFHLDLPTTQEEGSDA